MLRAAFAALIPLGLPIFAHAALENPLKFPSIQAFIEGVLNAITIVALPVIAFFIVFAGFKFITAQGNETELNNAKKNIVAVLIGGSLILGAWVLSTLIGGTVTQLIG